jgi:hypothetical protein
MLRVLYTLGLIRRLCEELAVGRIEERFGEARSGHRLSVQGRLPRGEWQHASMRVVVAHGLRQDDHSCQIPVRLAEIKARKQSSFHSEVAAAPSPT